MATYTRSQIVQPSDTARLIARFRGPDGQLVDLDSFPTVTVVQPSGGVAVGPTSMGVFRISTGVYGFDYSVGLFPPMGVWSDVWRGSLGGFEVMGEFNFTVMHTQVPAVATDGYQHLGDDPGFCYSQTAICNINHLVKTLRARLNSQGKRRTVDENGNVVYKDCDVYTTDELVTFIAQALSMFNEVPHFTFFTFEDTPIIEQFHDVLVQGALLQALSSQSLIQRAAEFNLTDNGIGWTPPTVSELLNTQWSTELQNWWDKVKLIKHNMKPSPLGLGTLRFLGVAPQVRRLRHLRARQLF